MGMAQLNVSCISLVFNCETHIRMLVLRQAPLIVVLISILAWRHPLHLFGQGAVDPLTNTHTDWIF